MYIRFEQLNFRVVEIVILLSTCGTVINWSFLYEKKNNIYIIQNNTLHYKNLILKTVIQNSY